MKFLVILSGLATIFILATANTTGAGGLSNKPEKASISVKGKIAKSALYYRISVDWHRQRAWYWQGVMFKPRYKTTYNERKAQGSYLRWLQRTWKKRHMVARARAADPPHKDEWFCIHGYEGAWNDDGAPYWGGLQMDLSFQRTYGGRLLATKGTANNWTMIEQMWVAERAFSSGRGFYPWPNTARYCNLIG